LLLQDDLQAPEHSVVFKFVAGAFLGQQCWPKLQTPEIISSGGHSDCLQA
jgi:hypothetical protein